jgi:hypothetical protein
MSILLLILLVKTYRGENNITGSFGSLIRGVAGSETMCNQRTSARGLGANDELLSYFQVEAPIHRPSFFLFFSIMIKDKTKISLMIKILHLG